MEHSQYCLGKLRGETLKVSDRKKFRINKVRFEAILANIHEKDPEEFTEILTARRLYFFRGTSEESYGKFMRWIISQEDEKLTREERYILEKLIKKGNIGSIRWAERMMIEHLIKKHYPIEYCDYCNTELTAAGQYELFPLHDRYECFWCLSPWYIRNDPLLQHTFAS